MLSLPVERKIPKVTELETIHATREQQEEMERLLKKKQGVISTSFLLLKENTGRNKWCILNHHKRNKDSRFN